MSMSDYDAWKTAGPDEYEPTRKDVEDTLTYTNQKLAGEYMARLVTFTTGDDYVIGLTYVDDNDAQIDVGTLYDVVQLDDWLTALREHEAAAVVNENGTFPIFAPNIDGGSIVTANK